MIINRHVTVPDITLYIYFKINCFRQAVISIYGDDNCWFIANEPNNSLILMLMS